MTLLQPTATGSTAATSPNRRGRGPKLRVLALVPVYSDRPPTGAFVTTREYLLALAAARHTVHVITTIRRPGPMRTENGVHVWPLAQWRRAARVASADLVISHHGDRKAARILRHLPGRRRHLLMVHGLSPRRHLGAPSLVWFPSRACADHYPSYRGSSLVTPPPINPHTYTTTPGGMVTLSGSTTAKGADVAAAIARQLPDTRFLIVRSGGPGQVDLTGLPNVAVIARTDPRRVYTQTRVLLMPSTTESYGRVGVEAALSGIPVVAAPLPGIREALGDAATYVTRDNLDRWVAIVRRLTTDPAAWRAASARAAAHTQIPTYEDNLAMFTAACLRVARGVRP